MLQRLTLEQQEFAALNHNLVYKYLRVNNLSDDGYYDIVIFGYIRAVFDYFRREELRKYKFSTIA